MATAALPAIAPALSECDGTAAMAQWREAVALPWTPQIGGYVIERLLGRGRRSMVYLAQDQLGRKVALKVARRAHLERGDPLPFLREFAMVSAIRHPNVMRVYSHGVSGGFAYIAMEHVAGGDLADRGGQPVRPQQALGFLLEAAMAVKQLHQRGFVHRDIKPANLLLRNGGALVLGDFGLVCAEGVANMRWEGEVVGTPQYAAPEQSQGQAARPAADVYSMGVIFYEMLCGEPPFPGQTPTEVLCQHLMAPVKRLPEALCKLQPLIESMLAKDANSRLSNAQAVLEQVRRLEGIVFPVPETAGPTERRCLP
jgi:serine/threonine protein kinase